MNLTSSQMSLIVSIVLVVFVVLGFIWGLIRGVKRSLVRFSFVVVCAVLAFFTAKPVLERLLQIHVNGTPLNMMIENAISKAVASIGLVASEFTNTANVLNVLIILLLNAVVFALVFFVYKIITWPIYAIVASLTLRKNPLKKKKRFLGGLIGIAQGIFVCFIFMVPVCGLSNIAFKISQNSLFNATDSLEQKQIIEDISMAYPKSVPGFMFGLFKLDNIVFDSLSSTKIDDVELSLGKEIDEILAVADAVAGDEGLIDLVYGSASTIEIGKYLSEIPVGETVSRGEIFISNISGKLFNSFIVKNLLVDSSNSYGKVLENGSYLTVVPKLSVAELNWDNEKAVFSTTFAQAIKIITEFLEFQKNDGLADIEAISKLPLKDVGEILDNFKNLALTKNFVVPTISYAGDKFGVFKTILDATQQFGGGIDLSKIDYEKVNFSDFFGGIREVVVFLNDNKDFSIESLTQLSEVLNNINNKQITEILNTAASKIIKDTFEIVEEIEINILSDAKVLTKLYSIYDGFNKINTPEALTNDAILKISNDIGALQTVELSSGLSTVVKAILNKSLNTNFVSGTEALDALVESRFVVEKVLAYYSTSDTVTSPTEKELLEAVKNSNLILNLLGITNPTYGKIVIDAVVNLMEVGDAISGSGNKDFNQSRIDEIVLSIKTLKNGTVEGKFAEILLDSINSLTGNVYTDANAVLGGLANESPVLGMVLKQISTSILETEKPEPFEILDEIYKTEIIYSMFAGDMTKADFNLLLELVKIKEHLSGGNDLTETKINGIVENIRLLNNLQASSGINEIVLTFINSSLTEADKYVSATQVFSNLSSDSSKFGTLLRYVSTSTDIIVKPEINVVVSELNNSAALKKIFGKEIGLNELSILNDFVVLVKTPFNETPQSKEDIDKIYEKFSTLSASNITNNQVKANALKFMNDYLVELSPNSNIFGQISFNSLDEVFVQINAEANLIRSTLKFLNANNFGITVDDTDGVVRAFSTSKVYFASLLGSNLPTIKVIPADDTYKTALKTKLQSSVLSLAKRAAIASLFNLTIE